MNIRDGLPADRPQALALKPPSDAKPAAQTHIHPHQQQHPQQPPALTLTTAPNPTPPLSPVVDDKNASTIVGHDTRISSAAGIIAALSADHRPALVGPPATSPADAAAASESTPLVFRGELEIQQDAHEQPIEFGRGAWSVVYSAVCLEPEPVSPLGSEATVVSGATEQRVFAVKTPLRRDAHRILEAEALLLSRLSQIPGNESHLVPFLGYISDSHALVMDALPQTLSGYITEQAAIARENFTTSTMFDPIISMPTWLAIVERLVQGLAWLHDSAEVVHGDVKPQNILLRPRDPKSGDFFPYDPVYVDFTSSEDLSSSTTRPKEHGLGLSALTPPFAAPEYLTIAALKSTTLVPSKAADVFSLAVTLLTAVTGDLQLYPGAGNMQCLAMSREGHRVLDFVRNGVYCSRVPRKGVVERILAPAVLKEPESRVRPTDWLALIGVERAGLFSSSSAA